MPTKKVILISGSLPPIPCGIGFYSQRFLHEFAATNSSDINLSVISTEGVDADIGFPLTTVPDWSIGNAWHLAKQIKAEGPDVVHMQYPAVGYGRKLGVNLLGYFLRLRCPKTRLIITLHEYHQSRLIGRIRNLVTLKPFQLRIVSNQRDHDALAKRFKNIHVIPIGVNLSSDPAVHPDINKLFKDHGLDPAKKTLYFFGFPFPNKQLDILLDAMTKLPDHQLLMLSKFDQNNPYHIQLKQHVDLLNQSHPRVAWTGFLDDTTTLAALKPGGYFIQPQAEPLSAKSSTALTAIACGQIVIAAGPGYTPFVSSENCVLLSHITADSIAAVVQQLDTDEALRTRIVGNLPQLATYFSWSSILQKHIEIYKGVSS